MISRFLPNNLHLATLEHVREIQKRIRVAAEKSSLIKGRTYLSQQHNLKSDEFYRKVEIQPPEETKKITVQYFETYGSKGHELSYGIGEQNISRFMLNNVISLIRAQPPIDQLPVQTTSAKSIEIRLTTNFYNLTQDKPEELPGFHWHKDTPGNGAITAVYTLAGEPVDFEIKHEERQEESYRFPIEEGSLLILSGAARWNWLHRIVPKNLSMNSQIKRERISLAVGFKPRLL